MKIIAVTDEEVGVVLSKEEAAVLAGVIGKHTRSTFDEAMNYTFLGRTVLSVPPERLAFPMFLWFKAWVEGEHK